MGTSSNVLVGTAQAWIAPAGTAQPTLPSTVGATQWVTPTTPWVEVGFTEQGVVMNVDRKVTEIRVEEQSTPVVVVPDTTDVTFDITFAEDTVANMQQAYGGGTLTTVAASGTAPGYTELVLADALTQVALLLYGVNSAGFQRQIYVPDLYSGGKVKTEYRRAKSPRLYPATFTAVCAMSAISIIDITAAVT